MPVVTAVQITLATNAMMLSKLAWLGKVQSVDSHEVNNFKDI